MQFSFYLWTENLRNAAEQIDTKKGEAEKLKKQEKFKKIVSEVDNILTGTPQQPAFSIFVGSLYLNRAVAKSQTKSCTDAMKDSEKAKKYNSEKRFQQYCLEVDANCYVYLDQPEKALVIYMPLWKAAMKGKETKKAADIKKMIIKAEIRKQWLKFAKLEKDTKKVEKTKEALKEIGTLTVDSFL